MASVQQTSFKRLTQILLTAENRELVTLGISAQDGQGTLPGTDLGLSDQGMKFVLDNRGDQLRQ